MANINSVEPYRGTTLRSGLHGRTKIKIQKTVVGLGPREIIQESYRVVRNLVFLSSFSK